MRRTLTEYCLKNSILLASFAMWEFSRLNRNKIAQCERENITEDKAGEYIDMGDASPLYRCIPFLVHHSFRGLMLIAHLQVHDLKCISYFSCITTLTIDFECDMRP